MYSPLGKTFKKQIKTIEKKEERQINGTRKHRKQLTEINVPDENDDFDIFDIEKYSLIFWRQEEISSKGKIKKNRGFKWQ